MGAKLPYQICEIGSICRMWRNTQNTHLPCSPISIHTFLAEGDCTHCRDSHCANISIHTFLAEGDRQQDSLDSFMKHFNPHLPYGRWLILNFLFVSSIYFNPHLPYGRWHIHTLPYSCIFQISIHTFLTEGDSLLPYFPTRLCISIHTFLTEGDRLKPKALQISVISIHTFLTEGDLTTKSAAKIGEIFQSTPSLRKVTEIIAERNE